MVVSHVRSDCAAWDLDYLKGFALARSATSRRVYRHRLNDGEIAEIARRSLRNFFRDCVEIGVVLQSSDEEVRAAIPIVGREHLDAALAKGDGVLVLSAHLGNFFVLGSRLALEGYPTFVLVNQPRDGRFAELMDRYRLKVKQRTIHARPRREALRELSDDLASNQIAVIIADEYRKAKDSGFVIWPDRDCAPRAGDTGTKNRRCGGSGLSDSAARRYPKVDHRTRAGVGAIGEKQSGDPRKYPTHDPMAGANRRANIPISGIG